MNQLSFPKKKNQAVVAPVQTSSTQEQNQAVVAPLQITAHQQQNQSVDAPVSLRGIPALAAIVQAPNANNLSTTRRQAKQRTAYANDLGFGFVRVVSSKRKKRSVETNTPNFTYMENYQDNSPHVTKYQADILEFLFTKMPYIADANRRILSETIECDEEIVSFQNKKTFLHLLLLDPKLVA